MQKSRLKVKSEARQFSRGKHFSPFPFNFLIGTGNQRSSHCGTAFVLYMPVSLEGSTRRAFLLLLRRFSFALLVDDPTFLTLGGADARRPHFFLHSLEAASSGVFRTVGRISTSNSSRVLLAGGRLKQVTR